MVFVWIENNHDLNVSILTMMDREEKVNMRKRLKDVNSGSDTYRENSFLKKKRFEEEGK